MENFIEDQLHGKTNSSAEDRGIGARDETLMHPYHPFSCQLKGVAIAVVIRPMPKIVPKQKMSR